MRKFEKISQEAIEAQEIKEIVYEDIILPARSTAGSAGYDFYAPRDIIIMPGTSEIIPTCIKAYMESDDVLMLFPRSGMGFKYGIRLENTVGVIDAKIA